MSQLLQVDQGRFLEVSFQRSFSERTHAFLIGLMLLACYLGFPVDTFFSWNPMEGIGLTHGGILLFVIVFIKMYFKEGFGDVSLKFLSF